MQYMMARRLSLVLGLLIVSALKSFAQVSFTGTQITQNFDTLAAGAGPNTFTNNSTLLGWYADQTSYIGDDGNSTTAGLYSYGAAASSERALGGFTKGGTVTAINYGVQILNNSGNDIDLNTVGISYTGEYWRKANNAVQTLSFSFYNAGAVSTDQLATVGTANTTLDYAPTPSGGNGAKGGLPTTVAGVIASAPGQVWKNGDYLWVRWNQTSISSNDQGLAVDNFALTLVPEPGTLMLLALGGTLAFAQRRRK